MTISNTLRHSLSPGDGVATHFDLNTRVDNADHLRVTHINALGGRTVLALDADYTVTGVGDDDGISVLYPLEGDPLPTGEEMLIEIIVPLTQETSLRNQSAFFPHIHERALDHLTRGLQQIDARTDRALSYPVGEAVSAELPAASVRAGKQLAFDATGAPVVSTSSLLPDELENFSYNGGETRLEASADLVAFENLHVVKTSQFDGGVAGDLLPAADATHDLGSVAKGWRALYLTGGAAIGGALTAASATLSGAVNAASAAIDGGISAASATLSGAISAASVAGDMRASQAEIEARSATDKLVTPEGLGHLIQTATVDGSSLEAGVVSTPHGLGSAPTIFGMNLVNTSPEWGFDGDVVRSDSVGDPSGDYEAILVYADNTNIYARGASNLAVISPGGTTGAPLNDDKWDCRFWWIP